MTGSSTRSRTRTATPRRLPPPTPSFGLFMPTPIAASSYNASPYLPHPPLPPVPPGPAQLPRIQDGRSRAQAVQPKYQLCDPLRAIAAEIDLGCDALMTPSSMQKGWEHSAVKQARPPLPVPPPAAPPAGYARNAYAYAYTAPAPPLHLAQPLPPLLAPVRGGAVDPSLQFLEPAQDEAVPHARKHGRARGQGHAKVSKGLKPGQVLSTSSTQYCRQVQLQQDTIQCNSGTFTSGQRQTMPETPQSGAGRAPLANSRAPVAIPPSVQADTPTRPRGPRTTPSSAPERGSRLRAGRTAMHRDSSASSGSSSSNSTDLHRRSAIRSLPPTRDYSSTSNRSHRSSLLSAISSSPGQPADPAQHIFPTANDAPFIASPPQTDADFLETRNEDTTLQWCPESDEEDEARQVWRRMEQDMGLRLGSGHEAQRGRWVVAPSPALHGGLEPRANRAKVMSPGQFTISDYADCGAACSDEAYGYNGDGEWDGEEFVSAEQMQEEMIDHYSPEVRLAAQRRAERALSSPLEHLDGSLFPLDAAPPALSHLSPGSPGLTLLREKTRRHPRDRTSMCRLDTHIVSALTALKDDWDSPELDYALQSDKSTPTDASPPFTPVTAARHRPLPLPFSTYAPPSSPPDERLVTPPPAPRPLPTPGMPSPREKGLGLGMTIALRTTYGLPPKHAAPGPAPKPFSIPAPGIPTGTSSGLGLIRKGTIRVERAKSVRGVFVIRDLDTGEAREVGMEELEVVLSDMARR